MVDMQLQLFIVSVGKGVLLKLHYSLIKNYPGFCRLYHAKTYDCIGGPFPCGAESTKPKRILFVGTVAVEVMRKVPFCLVHDKQEVIITGKHSTDIKYTS